MGGVGSGTGYRWDKRECLDDHISIDVRRWKREGLLHPGNWFGWQWTVNDEVSDSIRIRVEQNRSCWLIGSEPMAASGRTSKSRCLSPIPTAIMAVSAYGLSALHVEGEPLNSIVTCRTLSVATAAACHISARVNPCQIALCARLGVYAGTWMPV